MSNIAVHTVHVDAALSNYSAGYRFGGYISEEVLRSIPVTKESDLYYIADKAHLKTDNDGSRAPGARVNEITMSLSTSSYVAHEFERSFFLPDRVRDNADPGAAIELNATRVPTENLTVLQEIRTAALAAATSNVMTPTTNWDAADAIIESDVEYAQEAIEDSIGSAPNVAFCDIKVARRIVRQADIREVLKYTGQNLLGIEVMQILQGLFGLRWIVAGAFKNAANQGATESLSRIWGTSVYLAYVQPGAGLLDASWAKQFVALPKQARRWRVDDRDGENFSVRHIVSEKETVAGALYKLAAVI